MQKKFFKKITSLDITTSAFIMVLIIISKMDFFNINVLTMRVGISYTFLIVAGLILRFGLGLLVVILGDLLGLVINGTIGLWHYAYFVIPIFIFIITYFLKFIFKIKNNKWLLIINLFIYIFIVFLVLIFFIFEDDFIARSKKLKIDQPLKILMWVMLGLMILYSIVILILYFKIKSEKLKDYLTINIIVSVIFVLMIWFYGPIAQILWLSDKNNKNYWNYFSVFQFSRILKTPVMLPLYNFIVISMYNVHKHIQVFYNIKKW